MREHTACKITHGNLDSLTSGPFCATGKVVAQPSNITWESWVQRARRDKHPGVYQSRHIASCNTHDEPHGHDTQAYQDERVSFPSFIAKPSHDHSKHRGGYVDGYSEKLSGRGTVTQRANDGGKEEGYAIKRTYNT